MTGAATDDIHGRFTILKPHARGGLGQISLARDESLRRHVALKEIRPDRIESPTARERFVAEAEITGQLEHPGIVPIYALEHDRAGQPYYAMRFIQGQTLAAAIEAHDRRPTELVFRDLIRRFASVCQTIAYAHSKGVIHRDLKPANIMLGDYGETLVVDWGLAKRLESPEVEVPAFASASGHTVPAPAGDDSTHQDGQSGLTEAGQVLGTPAYMSPEQASGEPAGPAADVYALGAILYEVLTGQAPYQGTSLEVLRQVRTEAAPPPHKVRPAVPRALEAVCCKAMSRAIPGRYPSAASLAGDIDRWLADEPVSAWREPAVVRAGRWVRRHRTNASVAVALLLATAVGLAFLAAERERRRQDVAQRQAETEAALRTAGKRLKLVENGIATLGSVFTDLDPDTEEKEGRPLRAILADRLVQSAGKLTDDTVGDPVALAKLQLTLGNSLRGLGLSGKAIELSELARTTLTSHLGLDHPDTLISMDDLAEGYLAAGRTDEAIKLFEDTLRRQTTQLGPDHPDTLETMNNLGVGYWSAGRLDEAIRLHEESLRQHRLRLGADHPRTLACMNNLAAASSDAGNLSEPTKLYEDVLKLRIERLGPAHIDTLTSRINLSEAYRNGSRQAEALALDEEAYRLARATLGTNHPRTLLCMKRVGVGLRTMGRFTDAVPLLEEALRLSESNLGTSHPDTLNSMGQLGQTYTSTGRTDAAIPLLERAVRGFKASLGRDHPTTFWAMGCLDIAYHSAGRLTEALNVGRERLSLTVAKLGPDHLETIVAKHNLGGSYREAGRLDEAFPLLEDVFKQLTAQFGMDDPKTHVAMNSLAQCHVSAGRPDLALPLLEQAARGVENQKFQHQYAARIIPNLAACLEHFHRYEAAEQWRTKWLAVLEKREGRASPAYAAEQAGLGRNLLLQEKPAAAEPLVQEALAVQLRSEPDAWTTFETRSLLGAVLSGLGRNTDAEPLLLQGFEGLDQRKSKVPLDHRDRLVEAADRLVRLYEAWGRPAQAEAWKARLGQSDLPAEVFAPSPAR